jgi:uncharacterized protein (DUF433 family)
MVIAPHIEVDPNRCHGKPVIQGTRVLVNVVLGHVAAGEKFDEIAKSYGITVEDVQAAVSFANDVVHREQFYAASK